MLATNSSCHCHHCRFQLTLMLTFSRRRTLLPALMRVALWAGTSISGFLPGLLTHLSRNILAFAGYKFAYPRAVAAMLHHSLSILQVNLSTMCVYSINEEVLVHILTGRRFLFGQTALIRFQPDVVVGSSWGGCCAVHLMLQVNKLLFPASTQS